MIRKRPTGPYLAHLGQLDYGRGWTFWALAGSTGRASDDTEWVILRRGNELREAKIQLETGAILRWKVTGT